MPGRWPRSGCRRADGRIACGPFRAPRKIFGARRGRFARRAAVGVARAMLLDPGMRHHREPQDTARMLMTRAPTTAAADDNLLDAAARMAERNVRHLPIVDGDRHVVGILSDRDVRTWVGDSARPLHQDDALVR